MKEERLKIPYPVLVEGKYDRLRLLSVIDADIYMTEGFGVFRSEEKRLLLRALARKTKIIVLTDSDGAGKLIRSHISSFIPKDALIPLYVPQIKGKEKRKSEPSKAGLLGVEGMERTLLYELFLPFSNASAAEETQKEPITKADLYEMGLTGAPCSAEARDAFAVSVGLPCGMTPNAFLAAVNVLFRREEFTERFIKLQEEGKDT